MRGLEAVDVGVWCAGGGRGGGGGWGGWGGEVGGGGRRRMRAGVWRGMGCGAGWRRGGELEHEGWGGGTE